MTSVQTTAALRTIRIVLILTALSITIPAIIFLVPLDIIITAALVVMLGYAINMIYQSQLAKAENEAKEDYKTY